MAHTQAMCDRLTLPRSPPFYRHILVTHDGEDASMKHEDSAEDTREYPCYVRVMDGKDVRFSTKVCKSARIHVYLPFQRFLLQVNPGDLEKFHAAYGALLKSSMATLRKRDKKREKTRAEQAVRRKKRMSEDITIRGAKRGNGRRRRQRQVKAALKQQESQSKFKEREEKRKNAAVVGR